MILSIKLDVKDQEKLMNLFRALVIDEFNVDNRFACENNRFEAEIEIGEKPPSKITNAICECGTITMFKYNMDKDVIDVSPEDVNQQEEIAQISSKADTEVKNDAQEENQEQEERSADISEVEHLIEEAASYADFIRLLKKYFEIPVKHQVEFETLMEVLPKIKKIVWKEIFSAFEHEGKPFTSYSKVILANHIREKTGMGTMAFLVKVMELTEDLRKGGIDSPKTEAKENEGDTQALILPEMADEKQKVSKESTEEADWYKSIFTCFPHTSFNGEQASRICSVEDKITKIDKSIPIEDRIEKFLCIIGEDKLAERPAFTKFTADILQAGSYQKDTMSTTGKMSLMTWTRTANKFYKTLYDETYDENTYLIQSEIFLNDLRKILLNVEELKEVNK